LPRDADFRTVNAVKPFDCQLDLTRSVCGSRGDATNLCQAICAFCENDEAVYGDIVDHLNCDLISDMCVCRRKLTSDMDANRRLVRNFNRRAGSTQEYEERANGNDW
jgi:hypothetical protein